MRGVTRQRGRPFTLPLTKGISQCAQLDARWRSPDENRQAFSKWEISKGLIEDDRPVRFFEGQ